MTIRRATVADAAELARLRGLMYAEWGIATAPEWQEHCADFFREHLRRDDLAAFVVDGDAGLLACGVGWINQHLPSPTNPSGRRGHVASMSTDPGARRAGHGRAIFAALMEWFTEVGIDNVDLHATPMGAPLYESFGFRDIGARPMAWRRGGTPVTWPTSR